MTGFTNGDAVYPDKLPVVGWKNIALGPEPDATVTRIVTLVPGLFTQRKAYVQADP